MGWIEGEWSDSDRRVRVGDATCYYCGYDLAGLSLIEGAVCPECGTSTEPKGRVCPKCHYSFDGLDLKPATQCPECGTAIKPHEFCRLWSPDAKRFWWAFRFSPLATLLIAGVMDYFSAGRTLMVMVFPFSTVLLATYFAAGAEWRDDAAAGRKTKFGPAFGTAVVAALQWTVASSVFFVAAAVVISAVLSLFP